MKLTGAGEGGAPNIGESLSSAGFIQGFGGMLMLIRVSF